MEYVSNEKLDIIADETIAKAAWEKLERVHQGTNVALVMFFTFTDMLRRKYAEGASMEEHIASFAADNRKLAAMGKPLGDEMKALFLLASLPKTPIWEVFTTSYLQSLPANQPPTFEVASTRLLSQITHMKRNEKTTSDMTSALVSNAKAMQEGQGPYCDYHERHGHSTKDCRNLTELKKDQKGKKRKRPKERDKPRS